MPGLERPEPARGGFQEPPPPPPPPPLPPPHEHFGRPARESYAEATRSSDDSEALTTPRRRMTQPGTGPAFDPRGGLPPFTAALQPVPPAPAMDHPEPEREVTQPRNELAAPPSEALFPPEEPTPPPEPSGGALFRQTVRVSVAPNPGQPGSFVIELLEENELPAQGSEEGLLILLNPHSALLHQSS